MDAYRKKQAEKFRHQQAQYQQQPQRQQRTNNYNQQQQQQLQNRNFEKWYTEYLKTHQPVSQYSLSHTVGFIVFLYYVIRGVFSASITTICLGFLYGYLIAHTVPALLQKYNNERVERGFFGGQCSHCLFSKDTLQNPQFTFYSEWEMFKDNLIYYVITSRRTNCLSHLYAGKNRSAGHIFTTVKNKLTDLNSQQ